MTVKLRWQQRTLKTTEDRHKHDDFARNKQTTTTTNESGQFSKSINLTMTRHMHMMPA